MNPSTAGTQQHSLLAQESIPSELMGQVLATKAREAVGGPQYLLFVQTTERKPQMAQTPPPIDTGFMETTLQSSWQLLIKAPDTLPDSAEILITYRGDKNHSSKKKADTGLLINYLRGACQNCKRGSRGWGVSGREALESGGRCPAHTPEHES